MTNTLSSAHELCWSKISEHFFLLHQAGVGVRNENRIHCILLDKRDCASIAVSIQCSRNFTIREAAST